MRIAMLGHKRMPSREGGVEVVVEELSTRMASLGHEVTVYSRRGHNVAGVEYDGVKVTEYKGVIVKEVPTLDVRGLAALTSSYYATKAALADKPDVIHFHAEGPCAMIGMAKRMGVRTVATIHGLDWQRAKWGKIASCYIKHGEAIAAKQADGVIVLSENVRDYFQREYGRETVFIPNGIDPKHPVAPEIIKARYGLKSSGYVLYLGRIVPEKGLHYLLEAFAGIDTDKRLVIAGGSSDSGSYFDEIRHAAQADTRVLFTGYVQGAELDELYSNCMLYTLPSDLEGMPMSLLEAMAYGCCCLTSDIPECAAVLDGTGATFRAGDVESLRKKLEELINNPEAAMRMGEQARERAMSKYDWDQVVEKTLALYEG